MPEPSGMSPERELQVVLCVLRGEVCAGDAARRAGVAEQTVHNWKNAFLDAGRAGLAGASRRRSCGEAELEAENEELKAALGEAHVQLRVWKKGAEYLPALRSSRWSASPRRCRSRRSPS